MKRKKLTNLVAVVLFLQMIVGCERDNISAGYRAPYLGEFSFFSYSFTWSAYHYEGNYRYFDTVIHLGSVQFDRTSKEYIVINYRPENAGGYTCNDLKVYGSQIFPRLMESGVLIYPEDPNICGSSRPVEFTGTFIGTDSLSFSIGHGGRGGSFGQIVSGKRIK